MIKDLTSKEQALTEFMSEISERCYSAGWMLNLEYVLWGALLHGEKKYGHGAISQSDINTLKHLSNAADAWIIFDDNTEETAMNLEDWKERFTTRVEQHPQLLK